MKNLNKIPKENEYDSMIDYLRSLRGLYRQLQQQKRRIAILLDKLGKLDYTVEK